MNNAIPKRHPGALGWRSQLPISHVLVWIDHDSATSGQIERDRTAEAGAAGDAVRMLFAAEGFPGSFTAEDLCMLRDPLGKPYVHWQGEVEQWAAERHYDCRHLHISNTHDGGAHMILAAYDPRLAGIGIDAVHLPRLRGAIRRADYLRRFARHFMSQEEFAQFERACADDDEEQLRVRVAAHFSLMESSSKALGTGLKIGGGMGRPESLPKRSLGVCRTEPGVEWLLDAAARQRMDQLGAAHLQGYWSADHAFLVSVALLWRSI